MIYTKTQRQTNRQTQTDRQTHGQRQTVTRSHNSRVDVTIVDQIVNDLHKGIETDKQTDTD